MKLNEKITALRKKWGLSQEEFADRLNVSRQAVSRWEVGSAQPEASNLLAVCRLFGVSADYLLQEEYDSPEDMPGFSKNPPKQRAKKAGVRLLIIGFLGNFTIYLLSRFIQVRVPYIYRQNGEIWYKWRENLKGYSFKYFVMEHNLELLVRVMLLTIIIGLILIFTPKERLDRLSKKFKKNTGL